MMDKTISKGFTVDDYVLPKFNVELILPEKIYTTNTSISVQVTSKFTFNTDVYGSCKLQIYDENNLQHFYEQIREIIGNTSFTIPMSDIRSQSLMYGSIKIRALVTDNATALTMATEKDLPIVSPITTTTTTTTTTTRLNRFSIAKDSYQESIILRLFVLQSMPTRQGRLDKCE
ncbi:uncharacterized protein LOC128222653 [Mya arenaria]|uniref:uncharacterized protein LOC128222653 n=1 Tax=Mya arenaria TaxID=6604 RepID=UPI0022E1CCE4|nr:uncharacterized protein LOC128222653 [Mya arenaria]